MLNIQEVLLLCSNLKLLYVEDNKEARESTLLILEEFFHDITIAKNGLEGFNKFQENEFDIIITDINMPELSGLEMSKKIKEVNKDIPILIISAHKDLEFLTTSIELNIDGYIFKPLNSNDLIEQIYKLSSQIRKKQEEKLKQEKIKIREQRRIKKIIKLADIRENEQKIITNKIKSNHKQIRDSIDYASMIQTALMPDVKELGSFFKDYFVSWIPKDTVGGDIWLFEQLRHKDECLLMFIDCTGHGVPGAFVTMIVKSIEREIISKLKKHPEFDISPALIMGYFNRTMKKLLRQESKDSVSNAGFDGGIIYYNKRTQILKFAGAETPLFYMTKDGALNIVKGNRYSVGYKNCDSNYKYEETIIEVEEGMKFYCTTDGYLDQNGGEKDFPFGKRRFINIIKKYYSKPMKDIQVIFDQTLKEWESKVANNDRNDDITLIAFEIDKQSDYKEDTIDEIVKYEGVMTQNVIASCIDNIEAKITNIGTMGVVATITIEYCQNMMNYSKNDIINDREIVPAGKIEVKYINNDYYEIEAKNIVSVDDKNKIEPKLIEIKSLDKAGIKKRYRELRKSGKNTHKKGGGIGMYEIAKASDHLDYDFNAINKDKYTFTIKSIVNSKKDIK